MTAQNGVNTALTRHDTTEFSLGRLHIGRLVPPHIGGGGTSAGGQSVNGGIHEGGHRPYGGT